MIAESSHVRLDLHATFDAFRLLSIGNKPDLLGSQTFGPIQLIDHKSGRCVRDRFAVPQRRSHLIRVTPIVIVRSKPRSPIFAFAIIGMVGCATFVRPRFEVRFVGVVDFLVVPSSSRYPKVRLVLSVIHEFYAHPQVFHGSRFGRNLHRDIDDLSIVLHPNRLDFGRIGNV